MHNSSIMALQIQIFCFPFINLEDVGYIFISHSQGWVFHPNPDTLLLGRAKAKGQNGNLFYSRGNPSPVIHFKLINRKQWQGREGNAIIYISSFCGKRKKSRSYGRLCVDRSHPLPLSFLYLLNILSFQNNSLCSKPSPPCKERQLQSFLSGLYSTQNLCIMSGSFSQVQTPLQKDLLVFRVQVDQVVEAL